KESATTARTARSTENSFFMTRSSRRRSREIASRLRGLRSVHGRADVFRLPCAFGGVSVRTAMKLLFENCVLDLDTREVHRGTRAAPLSRKSFALLELLALRRPKALSKAEIHAALWPDTFVSETNLANLVVEIRAALGDDVHASRVVRTVPRFGYAFCAEARSEDSSLAAARGGHSEHRCV